MDTFERDLASLKQRIVEMGQLAEGMAAGATRSLTGADPAPARQVRASEPLLDRLQMDIDRDAISLIIKYSPAAKDLRLLLMIARVNAELERVGDHAIDICEFLELVALPRPGPLPELAAMCRATMAMLHDALEAFRLEDLDLAEAVIRRDDEVDAINGSVIAKFVSAGLADVESVPRGIGLVLTARSLERIADHATNICEDVFFVVTGQDIRHRLESTPGAARMSALPWRIPRSAGSKGP